MSLFSQRHGYKPIKTIMQIETIDEELRNGLWNALCIFYWDKVNTNYYIDNLANQTIFWLLRTIWKSCFKKPIDTIGNRWVEIHKYLREYFFKCNWYEVYDFIEIIATNPYFEDRVNNNFIQACNSVLQLEVAGYRFIDRKITQITSEEEIAEIEGVLKNGEVSSPEVIHLKTALNLFSDRKSPDYRNSIKESISAVETICRQIAGNRATLGKALGEIRKQGKIDLHGALEDAFEKLYGYTSDEGGIRHSLLEENHLDFEDAKFMLVSCAAFINYLKIKASKAGVKLK
jgi:hypothetical protein